MASVNGLNRLGLPKLSENMDPEDARVNAVRTAGKYNSLWIVRLYFL